MSDFIVFDNSKFLNDRELNPVGTDPEPIFIDPNKVTTLRPGGRFMTTINLDDKTQYDVTGDIVSVAYDIAIAKVGGPSIVLSTDPEQQIRKELVAVIEERPETTGKNILNFLAKSCAWRFELKKELKFK